MFDHRTKKRIVNGSREALSPRVSYPLAELRRCWRGALITHRHAAIILAMGLGFANIASAAPTIIAPDVVVIQDVVTDAVALENNDLMAFDSFGNLFVNREVRLVNGSGGVSYVDLDAGTAVILVTDIPRADGIALHPSGALYVTSEPFDECRSTTNRLFRIDVTYDVNNIPISATKTSIDTSPVALAPLEGIIILSDDNCPAPCAWGNSGDIFVTEDAPCFGGPSNPGRIIKLEPGAGDTATATIIVGEGADLRRPEGLAFGDFGGALAGPLLYAAETSASQTQPNDRVIEIAVGGAVSTLGNPQGISPTLNDPDGLKFGHDGKLYVTEDDNPGALIRIDVSGTHEFVLEGLASANGLVFDFAMKDLYVGEQDLSKIIRVRFETFTGDSESDGDVDLADYAALQRCVGAGSFTVECLVFDTDRNDQINPSDLPAFVGALGGP